MTLQEMIGDYIKLNLEGKILKAFEKYYADDVVMQENELPPTIGKAANREREKQFLANLTEFREAKVKAIALGDNVVMAEWFFDYTHKEWGKRTYHQVAVQRWKDGKIVHERFYYGA